MPQEAVKISSASLHTLLDLEPTKSIDTSQAPDDVSFLSRFSPAELRAKLKDTFVPSEHTQRVTTAPGVISYLRPIHKDVGKVKLDVEKMKALAPELEQSRILVSSSIMSPNDLQDGEFQFIFDNVPGLEGEEDLKEAIAKVYDQHFNKTLQWNIKSYDWIGDIQYKEGAKPILILPQATQDEIRSRTTKDINNDKKNPYPGYMFGPGMASFLGVPGTNIDKDDNSDFFYSGKIITWSDVLEKQSPEDYIKEMVPGMESFGVDIPFIYRSSEQRATVTDNNYGQEYLAGMESMIVNFRKKLEEGDVLKVTENPEIIKFATQTSLKHKDDVYKKIQENYRLGNRRYPMEEGVMLKPNPKGFEHYDHPTVMELPAEAVIPIHIPGCPSEHLGYFILLDQYGRPLTIENSGMADDNKCNGASCNPGNPSAAYEALFGNGCCRNMSIQQIGATSSMIFHTFLDKYLQARIRGVLGRDDLTISRFNAISTVMFQRLMEQKKTILLYAPTSLLHYICFAYRNNGTGQSLPHNAKIKTPNGWTTMGEVKIGDMLRMPDGSIAPVIGKYYQGKRPMMMVNFKDGRSVKCDVEHLWEVSYWKHGSKKVCEVITTLELMNLCSQYTKNIGPSIRMINAKYHENHIELPLHPYILGTILGDAHINKEYIMITTDDWIANKISNIMPEIKTVEYDRLTETVATYGLVKNTQERNSHIQNPILEICRNLKLIGTHSHDKFIPEIYLHGSYEQRCELLKGLIDTDGYISQSQLKLNGEISSGQITFSTTSPILRDQVLYLIYSIGGQARYRTKLPKPSMCNGKIISSQRPLYEIYIRAPYPHDIISLPRKKERTTETHQYTNSMKLHVTSVIPLPEKEECSCILVDHPDHLFITDNFIVTHNTKVEDAMFLLSLRTTFLVASMIAMATDAVNQKVIEIGVDEKEANLEGVMDLVGNIFIERSKLNGSIDPTEIMKDIYANNITIVPKNIPGLQELSVDVQSGNSQTNRPDDTLLEKLSDLLVSHFDVPPAALSQMSEPEFARSLTTYNLFFAKKIVRYQNIFCSHMDELVKDYTFFSPPFQTAIRKIVNANIGKRQKDKLTKSAKKLKNKNTNQYIRSIDKIVTDILSNVEIKLPKPNIVVDKTQFEEIRNYLGNLDEIANQLFSADMIPQEDTSASGGLTVARAMWKRKQLLDFITRVGKFEMVEIPDPDNIDHDEAISYIQAFQNFNAHIDQQRENIGRNAGLMDTSGGGYGDSGGFGDDMMGGDDMNMDMGSDDMGDMSDMGSDLEMPASEPEESSETNDESGATATMFLNMHRNIKR